MSAEKFENKGPTLQITSTAQRFLDEKGHEDAKTNIMISSEKINSKMEGVYELVGKMKYQQQLALKNDYTAEYIKASNDYTEYSELTRFVERETEADLRAELEREKIEVTNLREQLLKSTIDESLKYNKKKVVL